MTAINFLREYSLGKSIQVCPNGKVETAKVVTYLRNKKDEIVGFIAKCKDETNNRISRLWWRSPIGY